MIENLFKSLESWCGNYVPNYWPNELYLIISFGLLLFLFYNFYKKIFQFFSKHLFFISCFVWFVGVIIYMIGYTKMELNVLGILPRAILSSFKMFGVTNDLARIDPTMQKDAIYMTLFSVLHFIAAYITFMFIFRMIGYKLRSKFYIFLATKIRKNKKYEHVHLFWGINEASILLAEDIDRINKEINQEATIIFVDIDEDCENNCHKKATLGFITNTITINESEIARLDKIGALVDHCNNGPALVDTSISKDVFGQLKLNSIRNIVQNSCNLNIYLLSDDEDKNLLGALTLQEDMHLEALAKDCKSKIFVHARRDAYNEVFAHYSQYVSESTKIKIKLVDSAFLSIQSLKQKDDTLPVDCVKDNIQNGTIEAPFTAMVIGFSSTGQEAFKFLYEFSAFINSEKKRTPFKCYAIDEKMDKFEGLLRAKMPAITDQELIMIKASVDSQVFWEKVEELINKLNYIVIALNDDVLGMSLAVNLFKYALWKREKNLPKLKILLRCYDRNNESKMTEVESRLNESVGEMNVELKLFAKYRELFTYKNVVSDTILQEAKEYHYIYENSLLQEEEQWKLNMEEQWKDSFEKSIQLDKSVIEIEMNKRSVSRYHAIYEINRKISQNFSNALHSRTKMILMGFDEESKPGRLNLYNGYVCTRKIKDINYECNDNDAELLRNLAITEHERWIAAHKLMGYIYQQERDLVKKCHENMCDFDKLSPETQSYDYNVVDTTIKIESKKKSK